MTEPYDLDAERALLGAMLISNDAAHDVIEIVHQEDFYTQAHRIGFESIARLTLEGVRADTVTVASDLAQRGLLDEFGGPTYFERCLETAQHASHALHYAEIVIARAKERRFIALCRRGIGEADSERNIDEVIAETEQGLIDAITPRGGRQVTDIRDTLNDVLARLDSNEGPLGLQTGLEKVDELVLLQPGNLVLLGGRPGSGKTALASTIATNIAREEKTVLFFSVEMTQLELTERLLSSWSGIPHLKVCGREHLSEQERLVLLEACTPLSQLPLHIDASDEMSILRMSSIARRFKRQRGLDLIILDYLQLLEPEDRRIPREQQVAVMSRQLKKLAGQLEVPIICLAQLNRSMENRPDRRPRLSDLRESGALEQDANIALFVHRPELYDEADSPGEAEIHVLKNRSGETGMARVQYQKEIVKFRDLAIQIPNYNTGWPTTEEDSW